MPPIRLAVRRPHHLLALRLQSLVSVRPDVPGGRSYADEIWRMFGKKRDDYVRHDDSDSDNMDVDPDEILREERRAERAARLEDDREEDRLRQAKETKQRRKAGKAVVA